MKSANYWVCVLTRNGAQTLGKTLASILAQSSQPELVVVVDDGSTDNTLSIVESFRTAWSRPIEILGLKSTRYDIRRVPVNINRCYSRVERMKHKFNYSMISGDDCVYPRNYSKTLLRIMENEPSLAVSSGDWNLSVRGSGDVLNRRAPQGSGRFIRDSFWEQVGRRYPVVYGWESWVLFKALMLGYRTANFTDLHFDHLRALGSRHKFKHWGIEMRTLGYHPLFALLRLARNLVIQHEPISRVGNLLMLIYYLFPQLYRNDPYFRYFENDLRYFVRGRQLYSILKKARSPWLQSILSGVWKVFERAYPIT